MYPEKLEQIIREIESLEDRYLKSEFLLEIGERFKEVPSAIATRPFGCENKVPACESDAYVWYRMNGEKIYYYFAVENPQGVSAKALSALLDETLSGQTPENASKINDDIVTRIFGKNISMGKGEGLMGIVRTVKAFALQQLKLNDGKTAS